MKSNINKKVTTISPMLKIDKLVKIIFYFLKRISLLFISVFGKYPLNLANYRFHIFRSLIDEKTSAIFGVASAVYLVHVR